MPCVAGLACICDICSVGVSRHRSARFCHHHADLHRYAIWQDIEGQRYEKDVWHKSQSTWCSYLLSWSYSRSYYALVSSDSPGNLQFPLVVCDLTGLYRWQTFSSSGDRFTFDFTITPYPCNWNCDCVLYQWMGCLVSSFQNEVFTGVYSQLECSRFIGIFYLSAGVIIYIMTWSSVDGPLLSRDGMHGSANRNTQALAPLQSA